MRFFESFYLNPFICSDSKYVKKQDARNKKSLLKDVESDNEK